MPRVLFLFLDGVGLGPAEPTRNPLAAAAMPTLHSLLGDQPLTIETSPFDGPTASLVSLDAQLGIDGAPQSATGQAVLLTGENVPGQIGRHYGPKPNPEVAAFLKRDSLFNQVVQRGKTASLLNAYPPQYFEAIRSGRRLYSSIPMAVNQAGLPLNTAGDLKKGQAMSADFTGAGWMAQGDFPDIPVYSEHEAGQHLAQLASQYDLSFFEYWASDYAGHKQAFDQAVAMMEDFDEVLAGLMASWHVEKDLILLTSDHGNMEDMDIRGHTLNPVPGLLIGPSALRQQLVPRLRDLTDIAPAIMTTLFGPSWHDQNAQTGI